MEDNKIDLEEMEKKSEQVIAELKNKAQEDLVSVNKIQYGISEEDVKIVNDVKTKLENMLGGLVGGKDEFVARTKTNIDKFLLLKGYMQNGLNSNQELTDILKEQLVSLDKCLEDLNKGLVDYDKKISIIETVLKYLTFAVKEDGKCYVEQYAIDFAKLLLA